MKCPKCGAVSDVLATREWQEVFTRRSRQCHNGHRYVTVEVQPGNLDRRTLANTRRGVEAGRLAWRRRQAVAASTGSSAEVAARLGITATRVRQIRADAHKAANDDQQQAKA